MNYQLGKVQKESIQNGSFLEDEVSKYKRKYQKWKTLYYEEKQKNETLEITLSQILEDLNQLLEKPLEKI